MVCELYNQFQKRISDHAYRWYNWRKNSSHWEFHKAIDFKQFLTVTVSNILDFNSCKMYFVILDLKPTEKKSETASQAFTRILKKSTKK